MTNVMVAALEPRLMFVAAPAGALGLPTDNLIPAAHGFADTWRPLTNVTKPSANARSFLNVRDFDAFSLDAADLRATLKRAPMEFTPAAERPVEVSLPTPDGAAARFAVVETMVMDPRLAADFSGIKTYRGQGLDDTSAHVRLDLTPLGFHAQVISPGKTYYIDPYWHRNQGTYAAYWRTDVAASPENLALPKDLLLDEHGDHPADEAGGLALEAGAAARASGTQLRTYRTAVAATGEYTAFFGGTVAAGQAAIVTAINRVNGIYESELSVRLQLVANNSQLVFTNASTDPYSNNNGGAMLSQNQSAIDSRVGSANYDVGHVFSTGGGGVAYLSVVGANGYKAGGVTGLTSPVGDAFYVDYVAHELGHQFGGDHTFNTSTDSQREPTAAYEPGSGSTIMAYAGITGSDSDLQRNSDPYFHWKSFDQIISYLDAGVPFVGTRMATNNAVPAVDAGPDRTIPAGTPFALTATGSDANASDVLTYSWEQADLGPATRLSTADNGSSPLFRVYNPTTSPTRTFPKLPSVLAGASGTTHSPNQPTWLVERLPTVARAMDFRVTVRDNRAGGGGVNTDDVVVNVVNTGAAFQITSHNAVASLAGGSTQTITWNVAGTTGSGINAARVNIRLSTDGGQTFPTLLAANVANDGGEAVVIPNTPTGSARIKVEPTDNLFFDVNNADLAITASAVSAPPGTPDLVSASDTGVASGDNITNLDNSGTSKTLQFSVPGTVGGATVSLYAGATLLGSAVATGTTTTVTTNGAADLADGVRAITARQTEPGKTESANSAALSIAVDTLRPTGDVVDVSPDPRTSGVDAVALVFSEPVIGLTASDLSLTRSPGAASNLLTAEQALTSSDNQTFSLGNLGGLTSVSGTYTLGFAVTPVAVAVDAAGNSLAGTASTTGTWVHALPAWLSADVADASWDSATKTLAVSGAATITADPGPGDLPLVSASGSAAVLTIAPSAGPTAVHLATLKLSDGAVARVGASGFAPQDAGRHTLVIENADGLAIAGAGSRLDLNDNAAVLRGTSLPAVQALVTSGNGRGTWTGDGITSSLAAGDADGPAALGYAAGAQLGTSTFAGIRSLDIGDVVLRYTYHGDTNLDGLVNTDDVLNILAAGKLDTGAAATWYEGDFTFDGVSDTDDILQLLATGRLDAA